MFNAMSPSRSRRSARQRRYVACAAFTSALAVPRPASAHVKWFSNFDWSTPPRTFDEILTPTFWSLLALSVVTLAALVLVDRRVDAWPRLARITAWFDSHRGNSVLVIRVAAFITILIAFYEGTLITRETSVQNIWIERAQFLILALLLFPRMTRFAGAGLLGLWLYGAAHFGPFHLLDYVNVLGVGYFLFARPSRSEFVCASALPALYATVGFSLIWLGCEKLIYPQWGLYVLEQNPMLTLGLPAEFFLTSAAFVEVNLGFLLIICLFSRSLAVTITLVFFLTTCVFGKVEIIGHTLLHAALIVFLFEGPGKRFRPPAAFHRTVSLRVGFTTINFTIGIFVALFAYTAVATRIDAPPPAHVHEKIEIEDRAATPTLKLELTRDSKSGYNLRLVTTNFRFTPDAVGKSARDSEGHAHLYLDGQKIARIYGEWHHVGELPPGDHQFRATLNANDHRDFAVDGVVISAEILVAADRSVITKSATGDARE